MGHLAKACSIGIHPKISQPKLTGTTDKVSPQFVYGSDEESSEGNKSPTPVDIISTTGSADSGQYNYAESHESQDSVRSQKRQATYEEMGRIINLMNNHNRLCWVTWKPPCSLDGEASSTRSAARTVSRQEKTSA